MTIDDLKKQFCDMSMLFVDDNYKEIDKNGSLTVYGVIHKDGKIYRCRCVIGRDLYTENIAKLTNERVEKRK